MLYSIRLNREFDEVPGATFTGGGSSEACFYLSEEDNTAYGWGEAEFTGELDGCGEGTMRFRYVATVSAPDPETGLRTGRDVAWLIPGSGTGDFADVSAGTFVGTTDVTSDLGVVGEARGWVKC